MRNNENNIIFDVRNITSFFRNITSYFTGKAKIITLVLIIIMLSFVNIINTFALSYSSNIGVGFTFNPTLSISLSSSDLVINDLVPGSTLDSNDISISISTNSAYGYILSANVNNESLVHSNNINTFNSIATDADLSDLEDSEDSNIWGYSTSLDSGTTWSNYSGLSSSNSTTLINTNGNVSSNLDFKIGAKASSTQASGTYTGTINFTAVSNVAPMSLLDSFIASGAEQLNGYFKMQDMTHDICNNVDIEESELQLIDVRDNKVYWVAKLKDGNCWMTQNLDLDLSHEVALTSETSDIDPDSYGKTIYTTEAGYSKNNETNIVSWLPSTIDNSGIQRAHTVPMNWTSENSANIPGWANNYNSPYSADAGDRYLYIDTSGNETVYTSLKASHAATNDAEGCQHAHIGNYYNWSATVASNNTATASGAQANSICPKNWDLPANNEYSTMLSAQKITTNYASEGFLKIRTPPLYLVRSGTARSGALYDFSTNGSYQCNSGYDRNAWYLNFDNSNDKFGTAFKLNGQSVRCMTNAN